MSRESDNESFVKFVQDRLGLKIDGWAGKLTRDKIAPLLPQVDVSNSYSQRFLSIMPWLLDHEGRVFENDPDDPGNYVNGKLQGTKCGIDSRSHPDIDVRSLTESQATDIYWKEYWQKNDCESLTFPLGECFFNACVNTGPGQAKKFLDRSEGSWISFLQQHRQFYINLVSSKPAMKKYLKGWLARTNDLEAWIAGQFTMG